MLLSLTFLYAGVAGFFSDVRQLIEVNKQIRANPLESYLKEIRASKNGRIERTINGILKYVVNISKMVIIGVPRPYFQAF
jgi:hypothetical protein